MNLFTWLQNKGLNFTPRWVTDGSGRPSSKHSMLLASYHHPKSRSWRWAIYWYRTNHLWHFNRHDRSKSGNYSIVLPFIGGLQYMWQKY